MPYDLDMLDDFCREIGLSARRRNHMALEISLGAGAILCFQNEEREENCLVGFLGTPWHFHGDLICADRLGHSVTLDQLSLLNGLKEGQILVCEQEKAGEVVDRWLVHGQFNDELAHLASDERLHFRRSSSPD